MNTTYKHNNKHTTQNTKQKQNQTKHKNKNKIYININKAWNFIRQDGEGGGCSVLVLVGPDVDAISACKILSFLFQSELMSYKSF